MRQEEHEDDPASEQMDSACHVYACITIMYMYAHLVGRPAKQAIYRRRGRATSVLFVLADLVEIAVLLVARGDDLLELFERTTGAWPALAQRQWSGCGVGDEADELLSHGAVGRVRGLSLARHLLHADVA